jgi:nicotinate-nucleotide adenylyltransferase
MIGIYGGTFDPVHYGHLRTAVEVHEFFSLDEVRLTPCAQPPHREMPLTSAEMRLNMLTLAASNQSGLIIDRRELDREGYSYTVDTLRSLRVEMPDESLFLLIGTDAFSDLSSWHQWQQLFDYAHVIVVTRPSYESPALSDFLSSKFTHDREDLACQKAGCLFFYAVTQLDISATQIRAKVKKGLSTHFLLPDNVIEYIEANKLYLT